MQRGVASDWLARWGLAGQRVLMEIVVFGGAAGAARRLLAYLQRRPPAPSPLCRPEADRERAVAAVGAKLPRRLKRKRPLLLEDGTPAGGLEEYYDYVFEVGTAGHAAGWVLRGLGTAPTQHLSNQVRALGTAAHAAGYRSRAPACKGGGRGAWAGAEGTRARRPASQQAAAPCRLAAVLPFQPRPPPARPALRALQEEAAAAPSLKILEAAYRWKRQKAEGGEAVPGAAAGEGA